MVIALDCTRLNDNDQIPASDDLRQKLPQCRSNLSLDAISHHGKLTNFLANRNPDSCRCSLSAMHLQASQGEMEARATKSLLVNPSKISSLPQPMNFGQHEINATIATN
jgi:hypothetical protein